MCNECHLSFCPPDCPFRATSRPSLRCAVCGAVISEGENYCEGKDGGIYCEDCVDTSDLDELLRICGIGSSMELADRLGLVWSN